MKNKNYKILFSLALICLALVLVLTGCKKPPENNHTHEPSEKYESDAENHWNTCGGCDELLSKEAHKFGEGVSNDDADNPETTYTCTVCGYEKTVKDNNNGNQGGNQGGNVEVIPGEKAYELWDMDVANASLIKTAYDKNGNAIESYYYDVLNMLSGSILGFDPIAREEFVYENGKIVSSVYYELSDEYEWSAYGPMEKSHETKYTYGTDGKLSRIDYFVNGVATPSWDEYVYANDGTLERVDMYDHNRCQVKKFYTNGKLSELLYGDITIEFEYDEKGNILKMVEKTDEKKPDGYIFTYENGNIASVDVTMGEESAFSVDYAFDAQGRVTELVVSTSEMNMELKSGFTYGDGTRTSTVSMKVDGRDYATVTVEDVYNANGTIKTSKTTSKLAMVNTTEVYEYAFEYNADGSFKKVTETDLSKSKPRANTVSFTYDASGRLTCLELVEDKGKVTFAYGTNGLLKEKKTFKEEITISVEEYYDNGLLKKSTGDGFEEILYIESDLYYRFARYVGEFFEYEYATSVKGLLGTHTFEYGDNFNRIKEKYVALSGLLESEVLYTEDGKSVSDKYWKYYTDEDGVKLVERYEVTLFDANGAESTYEVYQYDALIRKSEYKPTEDGDSYLWKETYYNYDETKRITIYNEYEEIVSSIVYAKDDTVITSEIYNRVYDDKGNRVSAKSYIDGKLVWEKEYKLDKDGDDYLSTETYYDEDGSKTVTEYNEDGEEIRYAEYNASGVKTHEEKTDFVYDADGNTVSSKKYVNGRLVREREYMLHKEYLFEFIKKEITYNENGSKIVNENDEYGHMILYAVYDANGDVVESERYDRVYDEDGNPKSVKYYVNGRLVRDSEYKLDSDDYPYVSKYTYYFEDGTKRIEEFDENGTRTLYQEFDAAGNKTYEEKTELGYDDDGNLISEKKYVNGKIILEKEYGIDKYGESYTSKEINYSEDGSRTEYERNEYGEQTRFAVYDATGALIQEDRTEFVYDDDGRLISEKTYIDGKPVEAREYGYNWYGARYVKKQTYYHSDGSSEVYGYDEYGNETLHQIFDSEGICTYDYRIEFEYDEYGTIIGSTSYYNGELYATEEYTEDFYGVYYINKITYYGTDGSKKIEEYDEYSYLIRYTYLNAAGNTVIDQEIYLYVPQWEISWLYDDNGKIFAKEQGIYGYRFFREYYAYDSNGIEYVSEEYYYFTDDTYYLISYDENGEITGVVKRDYYGDVIYEARYEDGLLVYEKTPLEGNNQYKVVKYRGVDDPYAELIYYYEDIIDGYEYTLGENGEYLTWTNYDDGDKTDYIEYQTNHQGERTPAKREMWDEDGSHTIQEFDDHDNQTREVIYDKWGEVIDNQRMEYEYDAQGRIIGENKYVDDFKYFEGEYGYDATGEKNYSKTTYYYTDGTWTMEEYRDGVLISNADLNNWGEHLEYTYNENGDRLTYKKTDSSGNVVTFDEKTYNSDGKELTWKTYSYGELTNFVEYKYNENGDLAEAYQNGALVSRFEYNNGVLAIKTFYSSDGSYQVMKYDESGELVISEENYDANGKLTSELKYVDGVVREEKRYLSNGGYVIFKNTEEGKRYFFEEYDADGRIDEGYIIEDGIKTEKRYDWSSQIIRVTVTNAEGDVWFAELVTDLEGNIISGYEVTRDDIGRIETEARYEVGNLMEYAEYQNSSWGGRIYKVLQTWKYDRTSTYYEYDDRENMTVKITYDANGEVVELYEYENEYGAYGALEFTKVYLNGEYVTTIYP